MSRLTQCEEELAAIDRRAAQLKDEFAQRYAEPPQLFSLLEFQVLIIRIRRLTSVQDQKVYAKIMPRRKHTLNSCCVETCANTTDAIKGEIDLLARFKCGIDLYPAQRKECLNLGGTPVNR